MGKPLYQLTIGNLRTAETILSTDANTLNKIRSSSAARGLGASTITKSNRTTEDLDANEADRLRRDGAFLSKPS